MRLRPRTPLIRVTSANSSNSNSAQTTNGIVMFTRQSPSRTVVEYEVDGKTYNEISTNVCIFKS